MPGSFLTNYHRNVIQVIVLVDFLMLSPVALFLLWLFWYSAPAARPRALRWVDGGLAVLACVIALSVFLTLHTWLDIDGIDKSMIVVAVSYLTFVTAMGASWLVRWRLHGSQSGQDGDGSW